MSDKVKLAVIGIGGMGGNHLGSIQKLDNCELVAVCDIDKPLADKKAKELDVEAYYSHEELLKSKVADAVIIATPHYDHTTIAIAAMDAGVHVLTEKPVGVHKLDIEKMIAAHERNPKLIFAAMFNQRTVEAHKKLKKLIDSGEFGAIKRINWTVTNWFRSQCYYDGGGWRATWEGEGGGVLMNQCPHQLDLFQWFFGMPKTIRAFCSIAKYHNIEVEDDVTAFMEYEDGKTAVFITSTGEAPGTERLEIACERGKVVLENHKIIFHRTEELVSEFCATTEERFGTPAVWEVDVPIKEDKGGAQHQKVIDAYVNAIAKGTELIAKAEEGINSIELANAMIYSSMKNETVTLPLDGNKFYDLLQDLIKNSTFKKTVVETSKEVDMSASF
ncbi:MAG: Gfo/Idh/MocA family oxidoreductase [Kiritimatiellae bacterium]|jgi:predicted dehydrogenase|nr:Gfo/Idh/MocA family oxidoreductase [Kiritimatiellia bacterium]